MILHPTRRVAAFGALAAGCATPDAPLAGRSVYSESVMFSGADAEGRHFAAVRICTYPEAGVAWLWCMLLTPDGFWQYASNSVRAPDVQPKANEPVVAAYGAFPTPRTSAIIKREGPLKSPLRAELQTSFESMPRLGEAGLPVMPGKASILASFTPAAGYGGLMPGRTESFGRAHFHCTGGGLSAVFEGPAQFHEQPQTEPRFTTPFAFASLWSDDLYATMLQTPQGSGGYVIEGRQPRQVRAVSADLGADLALRFEDAGAAAHLPLEAARRYRVPVYDGMWQGRFVRGRFGARTVVGFLNSWRL